MTRRVERLVSTLHQAVQQVIARGLSDPRARGLITVTEVTISDDLKAATIFISVLPDKHQDLTLHALRHAARHIRRQTGDLMTMHQLPEFEFRLDTRLKQQAAVYDALARAREVTPGMSSATGPSEDGEGVAGGAGEGGARSETDSEEPDVSAGGEGRAERGWPRPKTTEGER